MCDLTSPSHELGTSPTTLGYSRDVALERQLAEAQPAQRELPHVGARTAAQVAAVAQANLVLRLLLFFGDLRGRCHKPFLLTPKAPAPGLLTLVRRPERHADKLQQFSCFLVGLRGGDDA